MTNPPGGHHAIMRERYGEDASALFGLGVRGPQADAMSSGNGLYLVGKCAAVLGGTPNLRFLAEEVCAELRLPLSEADATVALPAGLRIASVDDCDLTREIDALAFAELGIEAFVRGRSAEEITAFPEYVASLDPPPSLVLVDYRLDHPTLGTPFVRGSVLLPQLRALGYKGKLIMKSANSSSADATRYKAAGADDSIAKGLTTDALGRELTRVLAGAAVGSAVLKTPLGRDAVPLSTERLVNEQALRAMPPPALRRVMRLYEPAEPSGLAAKMRILEQRVANGECVDAHRLVGTAQVAGALEVERLARAFTSSGDSFDSLRNALEATRQRLVSMGMLLVRDDADANCIANG
eukprot:CAMPEP_0115842126 /NCGR_PEP_ID=MMETSP0287-20121206/7639_1 /TAXON_ID=412157 /ORGANISM="Chrysochromulina rotalis, Strain UIO044" /LENGTH=351 /DNA_ID=CAMNT_0003295785 /DNA_START=10 /DNA_END=1065 /DNA_ORIENTATION=-